MLSSFGNAPGEEVACFYLFTQFLPARKFALQLVPPRLHQAKTLAAQSGRFRKGWANHVEGGQDHGFWKSWLFRQGQAGLLPLVVLLFVLLMLVFFSLFFLSRRVAVRRFAV